MLDMYTKVVMEIEGDGILVTTYRGNVIMTQLLYGSYEHALESMAAGGDKA